MRSTRTAGLCAVALFCGATGDASTPVADHLAAAVRIETVADPEDGARSLPKFVAFHEFLADAFPRAHATLERRMFPNGTLLFTWPGTDAATRPWLLLAHQDVVAVERASDWTHPPFAGVIADGYVWGRGALDDKASLIAILQAAEGLLEQGFRPTTTLYFAFGADEEIGGSNGARAIAAALEGAGVRLAAVLDEGKTVTRGVLPSEDRAIAEIGIAEKGAVSVSLTVETAGGHSARPPAETAIGILAAAVARLEKNPFPPRVDGATEALFETLAARRSWSERLGMALMGPFGPFGARTAAGDPALQPYVRTTTAPTLFHAGVKDNVLPRRAEAVVNFRILPGDSIESVLAHVRDVVDDERVALALHGSLRSEPSPVSPAGGEAYQRIDRAVRGIYGEVLIVPSLVIGATDSRHFVSIADGIYRFAPNLLERADLARVHGTDERMAVAELERAVAFYRHLIRDDR